MNILYEKLPDTITVDGTDYPVHTDFRNWVEIEILLSEEMSFETLARVITLCYKVLPPDLKSAVRGIIEFHSMGDASSERKKGHKKPVYSYKYDGEYIYSAFMEKYGIDLSVSKFHWYQFRSLLRSLGECRFTKIIGWRSMDIAKLKSKEEKQFYRKMQRLYALPSKCSDIAECISDLF